MVYSSNSSNSSLESLYNPLNIPTYYKKISPLDIINNIKSTRPFKKASYKRPFIIYNLDYYSLLICKSHSYTCYNKKDLSNHLYKEHSYLSKRNRAKLVDYYIKTTNLEVQNIDTYKKDLKITPNTFYIKELDILIGCKCKIEECYYSTTSRLKANNHLKIKHFIRFKDILALDSYFYRVPLQFFFNQEKGGFIPKLPNLDYIKANNPNNYKIITSSSNITSNSSFNISNIEEEEDSNSSINISNKSITNISPTNLTSTPLINRYIDRYRENLKDSTSTSLINSRDKDIPTYLISLQFIDFINLIREKEDTYFIIIKYLINKDFLSKNSKESYFLKLYTLTIEALEEVSSYIKYLPSNLKVLIKTTNKNKEVKEFKILKDKTTRKTYFKTIALFIVFLYKTRIHQSSIPFTISPTTLESLEFLKKLQGDYRASLDNKEENTKVSNKIIANIIRMLYNILLEPLTTSLTSSSILKNPLYSFLILESINLDTWDFKDSKAINNRFNHIIYNLRLVIIGDIYFQIKLNLLSKDKDIEPILIDSIDKCLNLDRNTIFKEIYKGFLVLIHYNRGKVLLTILFILIRD